MSSECVVESSASPDSLTDASHPDVPAEPDAAQTETAEAEDGEAVAMCQFFLMGKCRFGQRCRLSHSDPSGDQSQAALDDQDEKQGDERKLKKKKTKAAKLKDNEAKEVNKKPRMRTADDVISRILWDSSVEASAFVVGYVDRFLGVMERPFCDFNWDASPCDCDYTTELALPRHRIQYFTYRGHRVWDRHSRTDRVFGSTGQSLAPPFGGEEEVEDRRQEQDGAQTTEDKTPAVCGQGESETEESAHTENTHLEDEKQSEMNIHTPDSALQSRRACVAEEAPDSGKEGGTLAERDQSGTDPGDDASSNLAAVHIGEHPSASPEQAAKGRSRPPKKRPTHFITFRANTPSVLSSFQQLQAELSALLPASAPHWLPSSSLHVTLCLLVLRGPDEVAAAQEILRRFAHLDRNPPLALTFPVKLKHFNGRVLYLSPQPQNPLQQLNSGLQEAYREEGLLHRDSFNPRYHLTLAKVPWDENLGKIFERVEDLKVGKGLNFGRLPINTLYLCAIGGLEVDGFYETVCSVNLR